jgi:tRNA (cmo5U34)-methyltransferase
MPALFDRDARRYDRARQQLVPCLDELYGWVARLLPFTAADDIRILDLGAGTGLLAARLIDAFPNAQITLLDASAPMLEQAAERFGGDDRFVYRQADYARAPLPGAFHAIVSALSIHHLSAYDKRALFRRVRVALEAGGVFVNADQVLGPTPELEQRYQQDWIAEARALGVSAADLAAALERQQADQPSTLGEQLAWLEEAGLRNVDCWYKRQRFAVMAGER